MPKKSLKKPITSFQKRVYEVIKRIPKGKVMTYKEVSQKVGNPRAWRAVGNILNKNRNPKIPCHRIIKSDTRAKRSVEMKTKSSSAGKVGGYSRGTKKKIALLKKEGITINSYGKIPSRFNK